MSDNKNTLYDNAIGWMIMGAIMLILLGFFWYFYQIEVKNMFRWIRWGQIWLISQVMPSDYEIVWNGTAMNYDQSVEEIKNLPKTALSNELTALISYVAMRPLKWVITAVLAGMALWALFRGPETQYRRSVDINKLIEIQSSNFKSITPFIKFNPSNVPPRPPGAPVPAELPAFAEALGPEEWIAYNQIPIPDGKLDEDVTEEALTKQLSKRWKGAQHLPDYKQVLLAGFCLKAVRKRSQSDDFLGRVSACWSHEKGLKLGQDKTLVKEARAILRDKKIAGDTLAKCNMHGFENTALLRGLQTAREEGGVLAPATFVWLRAHDRDLWYALNNLGRQAFHAEALGTMSHFKAEKRTNRPIPRPKLQDALTTIREYVESSKLRPIPQLDYSGAKKKRGIKKPKSKKAQKKDKQKENKKQDKAKAKSKEGKKKAA